MRDQVVVVTGASSGVGRAVARAYGARRAKVALIARNQEALDACAAEMRHAGGEAMIHRWTSSLLMKSTARPTARCSDGGVSTRGSTPRWRRCSRRSRTPPRPSSDARPRSVTSVTCMARWRRCVTCCPVITGLSFSRIGSRLPLRNSFGCPAFDRGSQTSLRNSPSAGTTTRRHDGTTHREESLSRRAARGVVTEREHTQTASDRLLLVFGLVPSPP